MCHYNEFDVIEVPLLGKNLIEASAGTGKTYSIAILVLRLIIEKKFPVENILMVTFTKAAVAELESRIRKFVRQAYRYASDRGTADQTIVAIVDSAGKENAGAELKKAVQSLDQLSVMTIHSFCEQCLTQYPFETRQSFRFDIATDISDITDLVVNDFWRRKITTLDLILFRHFSTSLTRDTIREVLIKALDDKEYIWEIIDEDDLLEQVLPFIASTEESLRNFENHIRQNFQSICSKEFSNKDAAKFIKKNSSSPSDFISSYVDGFKKGTKYIKDLFPDEYELYSEYVKQKGKLDELSNQYVYQIFGSAIEDLKARVASFKADRKVIDFNDQIKLLYQAVSEGHMNHVLSSHYDVVFIDEFQDTDNYQYEIFKGLFSEKIIFYIGDPKQSIYGWRKADIQTYLSARNDEDTIIYTMNRNFRSTPNLIEALNDFFSINDAFADPAINYHNVEAGLGNLGLMAERNVSVAPFDIYGFDNMSQIERFVVSEIGRIIGSGEFSINGRELKYSDIAVIVRKNKEGRKIKKALSRANIPAVTIDDAKVLGTDEAVIIRQLMEAVIKPQHGSINRVLLNPCFGIDIDLLLKLDDDIHLENFRALNKIWYESGIYNMIFRFLDLYQVRLFCLQVGIEGQRILTNLYHIAEILHQTELQKKSTPGELLSWCYLSKDDPNDEFQQRIESQDDAVQITTIHKCKGLTYKIVFAPFLDLKIAEFPIYEFREEGTYKFTHQPTDEQLGLWSNQTEQENRRLIYVALTRPQYKIYLCINNFWGFAKSSIKGFPIEKQVKWVEPENDAQPGPDPGPTREAEFSPRPLPEIQIKNTFGIHSFSALSKAHYSAPFEKQDLVDNDRYDQFIFQELGRGAKVGTALHNIFEHLNFNNPGEWMKALQDASKYWPRIIKEENLDLLRQLLVHVMNADISTGNDNLKLCNIKPAQKLPELEFFFSVDQVNKQALNEILGEEADLGGEADIDGLMTGFIDLVFEQNGKYYILDWKSNHLGNSVEDYGPAGLGLAMAGSNYNLQYMIYTVALKRWLATKIPDFDYDKHFGGVIYVFLRGVREKQTSGIFFTRPSLERVERLDKAMSMNVREDVRYCDPKNEKTFTRIN